VASRFRDFLSRNSVVPSNTLPLVHSTPSYRLDSILEGEEIVPTECDVFRTPLTYFFVGRPAYKVHPSSGEAEYWELPSCFIFEYDIVKAPEKIFPFDSGALHKGRMPNYVDLMDRDDFDVQGLPDAPARIIGAYFPDLRSYMKGKAKDTAHFQKDYTLGIFETQAKALHRMSIEKHNENIDDRRLSVEISTKETIDLKVSRPIAVVAPDEYFADAGFMNKVAVEWGALPIAYPISSLNTQAYYALIYERVESLYRDNLKLL